MFELKFVIYHRAAKSIILETFSEHQSLVIQASSPCLKTIVQTQPYVS